MHKSFLDDAAKGKRVVKPDDGIEFRDVDAETSDSEMEELVKRPTPQGLLKITMGPQT